MSEKIVQFNEEVIKGQIKELVRGSVEETLNDAACVAALVKQIVDAGLFIHPDLRDRHGTLLKNPFKAFAVIPIPHYARPFRSVGILCLSHG